MEEPINAKIGENPYNISHIHIIYLIWKKTLELIDLK